MLNGLDLFSGIGGITYALQDWIKPGAYCEIEPYCQSVLLSRMQEGNLPKAPIWDDIRTLQSFRGGIGLPSEFCIRGCYQEIDIIYGGFPCQDISIAGAGKGLEGERSNLFFEIVRLAEEIKPKFLFLENVPAITTRGGLVVVKTIAEMGYDCRWCVISASGVGALHRRARWFLLAYSNGITSEQTNTEAFTFSPIKESRGRLARLYRPFTSRKHWQEVVSGMDRVTDGLPYQLDRIRALGNAVVPQQVRKAWEILTGLE